MLRQFIEALASVAVFFGLMLWLVAGTVLLSTTARADTGLAQVCLAGPMPTTECTALEPRPIVWRRPRPDDAVPACHLADPSACVWADVEYEPWRSIPDTSFIHICTLDLEPNVAGVNCPGDENKPWTPKPQVATAGVIVNGTGTVTLSWQRPTELVDGTPLPIDDIAGYRVYWGPDPAALSSTFDVDNGAVSSSSLELELDGPTTLYFGLTARHVNGQESELSNIVARVFELELIDNAPGAPALIEVGVSIVCTTDTPGVSCTFTVQ